MERLAENPNDLYKITRNLGDEGMLHNGRILYPMIDILGAKFILNSRGAFRVFGSGLLKEGENEIHEAFETDTASVMLVTGWGGGTITGQLEKMLHRAQGNSFMTEAELEARSIQKEKELEICQTKYK